MPRQVKALKNLTKNTAGPAIAAALPLSADPTISADGSSSIRFPLDMDGSFATETDNVEVDYIDESNKETREVGGVFKYDATGKTVTISSLKPVPKTSMELYGQIEIGDKTGDKPDISTLSVRFGNMSNKAQDWILNFSDTQDGAPGTDIGIKSLINWIKARAGITEDVTVPQGSNGKNLSDLRILFKEFRFNITQKTFNIKVISKPGPDNQLEIMTGLTLKNIGFQLTNEPVQLPGNSTTILVSNNSAVVK